MQPDLNELFGLNDIDDFFGKDMRQKYLHIRKSIPAILRDNIVEAQNGDPDSAVLVTMQLPSQLAHMIADDIEYATSNFPDGIPAILPRDIPLKE